MANRPKKQSGGVKNPDRRNGKAWSNTLNMIRELEGSGILGSEECPDPNYWHWRVLKPEQLPEWLQSNYVDYGEIRFYW